MSAWRKAVRTYLLECQAVGRSNHWLETSAFWLKQWMAWCDRQALPAPAEVTTAHLGAFCDQLLSTPNQRGVPYSLQTVHQSMQVLRTFFNWAFQREFLIVNPAQHLVLPRIHRELRQPLTMHDVRRLLEAADDGSLLGLRNRAVLETFYSTGIRRSELLLLDMSDLDLRQRWLHVKGKGGTERFAPVGEKLAHVLEQYLHRARPYLVGCGGDPALFLSVHGTRLAYKSIQHLVKSVAERIGTHVRPHDLRHAFAVHLLECGADFYDVSRLLGHRNPKSTEIYTHITKAAFRRVYRCCHPRAQRTPSKERYQRP